MTVPHFHPAPEGPLVVTESHDSGTRLSVVVPTYREEGNIRPFLTALCAALDHALRGEYEVIVVDDDSPDETLLRAAEAARDAPHVKLIRRVGERGLATAVIRGWQAARGQMLATINADFQHPPEVMVMMWHRAKEADLVVASRYCAGGGVGDWPISRRVLSRGAQALGGLLLPGVYGKVSDPLSGCYMFRREVIAGVELKPIGYKSLIEILARGRVRRIAEQPYQMRIRASGASKASYGSSVDYLRQLILLRGVMRKARP
jgi:dolichol-phosphate mannosyltransferase